MGDGYFYTLSAIAQSFAAIIALNAIFVIYKLQIIKNQRQELMKKLVDLKLEDMIKKDSWSREDAVSESNRFTENFLLQWASDNRGSCDMISRKTGVFNDIDENAHFSKMILGWLKKTLLLNGTAILLSLILLPWKYLFPEFLQIVFLILILILSLFALLVTIHAILVTVKLGGIPVIENIFGKKSKS